MQNMIQAVILPRPLDRRHILGLFYKAQNLLVAARIGTYAASFFVREVKTAAAGTQRGFRPAYR
jgi:hypothetical protein